MVELVLLLGENPKNNKKNIVGKEYLLEWYCIFFKALIKRVVMKVYLAKALLCQLSPVVCQVVVLTYKMVFWERMFISVEQRK